MFEVLSLIAVMLVAAHALKRHDADKSKGSDAGGSNGGGPEPLRVVTPAKPVLALRQAERPEGSESVPRDARFAFVSGFGVRPDQLKELHIYATAGRLEEFPQKVSDLLRKLYANGFAVGEEIMALLHHDRPLKEGEAIYVAVARDDRTSATRTVAFVDRRRAC